MRTPLQRCRVITLSTPDTCMVCSRSRQWAISF